MTSGAETLGAATDAASVFGPLLRLGAAALLVVLAGAGWFYWQRKIRATRSRLQVLDRAFLARGACVALLSVDERRLLVGVTAEGVRLLRDLDAGSAGARRSSFPKLLDEASGPREARG